MGQLTVKQIATEVLAEINVTAFNETPKGPDLYKVVRYFNRLVDSYKTKRLYIQKVLRSVYNVTANQAVYTWGPGGDWDGYRPEPGQTITAGFVATNVNPTDPLETPVHIYTDQEWPRISLKTLKSNIIWGMWTDYAFPLANVNVYPISQVNAKIAVYVPTPLDEVAETDAGINTTIQLPPGYRQMFIVDLAFMCAGPFEKPIPPDLVQKRTEARLDVKRGNIKMNTLKLPAGLRRRKGIKLIQGDM